MATATQPEQPAITHPPREYHFLGGLLSYLVPGLGQIVQGRVAKGLLFLVCIYALFFYGLFLGSGTAQVGDPPTTYTLSGSVYLPNTYDPKTTTLPPLAANLYNRPQFVGQFFAGIVAWPAVWQYAHFDPTHPDAPDRLFGLFMKQPTDETLNAVHTTNDKIMDLGWVFTVIAGVLNIMVIYDAVAGPAFPNPPTSRTEPAHEHPAA